jgi:hypothetical protein
MGPHNETVIGARADTATKEAAKAALGAHGWTLQEFIVAALRTLVANPAKAIRFVAAERPERKPTGRPRKRQPEV